MSTTGRTDSELPPTSDVATQLRESSFVQLTSAATVDGIAAAGVLARALEHCSVPYQLSVVAIPATVGRDTNTDLTVTLDRPADGADLSIGTGMSATRTAFDIATEIGSVEMDLTIAGCLASDGLDEAVYEMAQERDIGREPGIAIPRTDVVDGLVHSTLVHGPFSGSKERARELLSGIDGIEDGQPVLDALDADTRRELASAVSLDVARDPAGIPQGSSQIVQFLRPYSGTPLGTIGGYSDVLGAAVREEPRLAVAAVLGSIEVDELLNVWQSHGELAHASIEDDVTNRYDGLFVIECETETTVGTVASLVNEYRSPEAVTLALAEETAEVIARPTVETDIGSASAKAAASVGGTGSGTTQRGRARFDCEPAEFVTAFREEL